MLTVRYYNIDSKRDASHQQSAHLSSSSADLIQQVVNGSFGRELD